MHLSSSLVMQFQVLGFVPELLWKLYVFCFISLTLKGCFLFASAENGEIEKEVVLGSHGGILNRMKLSQIPTRIRRRGK